MPEYSYILYVDVYYKNDMDCGYTRTVGAFTNEVAMNEYMDKNPAVDDVGNKDGELGKGWKIEYRTDSVYIIA